MSKRITVSVPDDIYWRLEKQVPERQLSKFVSDSIEEKLVGHLTTEEAIRAFFAMSKELPKRSSEEIKAAIEYGRM